MFGRQFGQVVTLSFLVRSNHNLHVGTACPSFWLTKSVGSQHGKESCYVELIMKDISTVRYRPQRLWEWAAIASEAANTFAGQDTCP